MAESRCVGALQDAAGPDLARVLTGAARVTGPAMSAVVATWPSPSDGGGWRSPGERPAGWEEVTTDDRTRIAVTAHLVQFARGGPGYLYLHPEAPLWRVDLDIYQAIVGDLFGLDVDNDRLCFGLVAEDGRAGILASSRSVVNGHTTTWYELACWGLDQHS